MLFDPNLELTSHSNPQIKSLAAGDSVASASGVNCRYVLWFTIFRHVVIGSSL